MSPMWSASDSCARLHGRRTPTVAPAPRREATAWTVAGLPEERAAIVVSSPTLASVCWDERLLADPLAAMTGDHVADLMSQYRREPAFVAGDRQDARVDGHLAAGQGEGIRLLVVLNEPVLPLVFGVARDSRDAAADPGDHPARRSVGGKPVGRAGLSADPGQGAAVLRRCALARVC